MKIKKLEITGFKSFVDKTSIAFPSGISAIVGPNGCGKSNVVDALMWVMGEQSVKQLRGKSMEDIIFSGTDGKPPLNMAEVSLTIANDNGSIPEEYKDLSEIMITRRLYRSGERAYFLNKKPCRLKDINNIFMDSGMGAKSCAVIQQGNIGAITDAGPNERRFFIEEAAGVTRYKNRKEEALRKVEATKQNLLRVDDIILEVKRQMNGLKRQAKKAELYKKFRAQIKEIDILISLIDYKSNKQEIDDVAQLIKELKDKEFTQVSELSKLDALVEEIKIKRVEKNREISKQKSLKFETQRNTDKLENDLLHHKKEVERISREVTSLVSASHELDAKNKNIEKEIVEVEHQDIILEEEITKEKKAYDKENLLQENFREQLNELNKQLEIKKTELMNLVAREAKYKNIYQNASNNKENLNRRLKRIAEEEVMADRKAKEIEIKEKEAKEELESIKQEIESFDNQIDSVKKKIEEKNQALGRKVKQVQTLYLERNNIKSRYDALKKMDDNFEWYKDGVRAIMAKDEVSSFGQNLNGIKKPERENILCMMADIVEPNPGYETAVEAIMGESLQYIIVKDQSTGAEAIDYLKTCQAGRSGFVPISSISVNNSHKRDFTMNHEKLISSSAGLEGDFHVHREKSIEPARSENFSFPLLIDFLSVEKEYENVASTLLSDVVLSEDLNHAVEVWNNLNSTNGGSHFTIVTKDGDVISQSGVMLGGSNDNMTGILAKKQELKELENQLVTISSQLEIERNQQGELESSIRSDELNLQKTIEQKKVFVQDEREVERLCYKTSEDLKHARRHHEIVTLEKEQLLGEESDIDDEMAKYRNILSEVENDVKTSENNVTNTSNRIEEASSNFEEFNQRTVDIKLKLTGLKAKFENSNNTLRRLKDFHGDGVKRFEQLTIDIDGKVQRKSETTQKIAEYENKISTLYRTFKSVERELECSEEIYKEIESNLKVQEDLIVSIKSEKEKDLEKYRYLEVEQSQRQMKLENIANRLEDRYHHPFNRFKLEYEHMLKNLEKSKDEMVDELAGLKEKVAAFGDVNLGAIEEYEEHKKRYEFLNSQKEDLEKAIEDLYKVIRKTNKITKELFLKTFDEINSKLKDLFPRLFGGGSAKLELTEPNNPLESGIELMIHPPGKNLTRLSLLSGGEKALSAIAFIFSIFLIRPASFCLMDEIDAPLDESNVFRFNDLVKIIGEKSQIIMITHNKNSMEFADLLLGVTMQKRGISQVVSVNLQ